MNVQRKFVTALLLLALLLTEGCNKKKPVLPVQAQASTIPETLPDEIPEKAEAPSTNVRSVSEAQPTVKTKPKKPARVAAKKNPPSSTPPAASPAPASPPASQSSSGTQTVATLRPPRTGGAENTPDLAIAAAMPSQQVVQQKEETARIVDATENAIKNLNRSLSEDEKATRTQIQSYLQQSRKATSDGDFERAYNLAKKAQLLADALIKK